MTEAKSDIPSKDQQHKPASEDDEPPEPGLPQKLDEKETRDVEEHQRLRSAVVYEIIRLEGEEELARRFHALWWSGLAAGISIGLSVICQAMLAANLPDGDSYKIIEKMGYAVGFLVVILAGQQLFTENVLTAVLPVIARWRLKWLAVMLRLWGIVLAANMVGAMVFAATIAYTSMLTQSVEQEVYRISAHMMENTPWEMFIKGIPAGWIIAVLVWVMPSVQNSKFFVIGLLTYIIALGEFTHIIAGSVEAFYLWIVGAETTFDVLFGFFLPVLAGNVVGGTVLFAVISYAQVREEIKGE
jgi:formate/nitrite transporter FocA (FNT family)